MKQKRLASKTFLAALMLLLFATTACLDEKYETQSSGSSEKSVTFSLFLPGTVAGGSTYALTPTDEEEVANVQVLLFSPGDLYLYTRNVSGTAITAVGNKKQFTVQIPEGTYSSVVVLGNSADIVSGAGLATTDNKAAVLAKLTVATSDTWVADKTNAAYRPIPMWGELGNTVVNQTSSAGSQNSPLQLSLIRMLAKVSVVLAPDAATNFKLSQILTPNSYTRGYVAPLAANWGSGIATHASVPTGATKQQFGLIYSGDQITTTGVACEGEIYLFESDNASQTGSDNRTCLILGGFYVPENRFCYYRVDFVSNNGGTDRYIDILRNHHYAFSVTKIDGPGYQSPNEAFLSKPINIETSLVTWNDAEIPYVGTDERYMLGLSQREYTYLVPMAHTSADSDNKLTIITNHPSGWQVTAITDSATNSEANWLSLNSTDYAGVSGSKTTISLLLQRNSGTAPRVAKIVVQAGTIKMTAKVKQWHEYYPPKHSGWAGSNIYWDAAAGKLTFDDVDDQTHSTYQGVFFQWGSLTGVSPSGNYDKTTTLLYAPGSSVSTTGTAWDMLPRATDENIISYPPALKTDRDRGYLYELDTNNGVGDICKYLTVQAGGLLYGKKWRMPTSKEFDDKGNYSKSTFTNTGTNASDGTRSIEVGFTKTTDIGTPFFPMGGFRDITSGNVTNVILTGGVWSASAVAKKSISATTLCSYAMIMDSNGVTPATFNEASASPARRIGYPVRCVVE